jgi:PAS domain S-box-containing protein
MNDRHLDASNAAGLRERAEDVAQRERADTTTRSESEASSPDTARQAIHDLRVHQIELEMQNEELRRAQSELEASRARYFDLYDLAPVGYLTLSEKGMVIEANLTAARLLGLTRGELVNQPLTRFILSNDQDTYYRGRRQLLETGTPQKDDLRLMRKDRDPFWARLEATRAQNGDEAPTCRVVVSDITQRKRAEQTLSASEMRHRVLFEKSRDALMTLAPPAWRFTAGNATAIKMFGARDEKDFVSQTPWTYSPDQQPDGRPSFEKAMAMIETAMREGSVFFDWTHRRPSGEVFPASVLLTRMEIDGQPLLHATVRDETEETTLRVKLAQADRLASMGMLAAGVAHEINNPLTYVLSAIESLAQDIPRLVGVAKRSVSALKEQVGDAACADTLGDAFAVLQSSLLADVVDCSREALEGMHRIKSISRALNTFARVEEIERSMVDLNYAMECAITMAANEVKYRAKLNKEFGTLPPVLASDGKLSQVFLNLLINASHAIDDGDIDNNSITIRTWTDGDEVFAEVRDTGRGIPKKDLARIFEPFFTTKRVGVGSGLGLTVCKNIVTEFGGDIQVESDVGLGARFVVRLPVADVRESIRGTSSSESMRVAAAHGRILVVDDENSIRAALKRLLGNAHDVVTAASGEEGQAILEKDESFDLVLCDVMMQGMSGMDLHKWLVKRNRALARQMVFITGGAFTPKASEYLSRVGNLKLEKPFDLTNLKRLVSELVLAAKSKRQPTAIIGPTGEAGDPATRGGGG